MEKFGMNFGGGPSKKDLLETVESQKQQLLQYQARLKDVVRAYKSLLKEKEALEASLRALSVPQDGTQPDSSPSSADPPAATTGEEGAGSPPGGEEDGPPGASCAPRAEEGGVDAAGEPERRVQQLRAQLATLTSSLATVTQEKSRMEASYQADKKKMKQELEEALRKAGEEAGRLEAELRGAQQQLAETKARLITQQHDRAREQSDHAAMLRELQRLLQSERSQRREAELQLEETREALVGRATAAERAEGYEQQMGQLSQELDELKRELRAVQEESNAPDPRLRELQEEMASLRNHFQVQLLQEMKKTAQAEEQLRQQAQLEERRVAALESRVSEVSELLGCQEQAKQRDQAALQRLRDRVVQLELENQALAASRRPGDEAEADVDVLRDRMEKLKELLREAARRSRPPVDVQELCQPEPPAEGEKHSALYYQQELKRLKEEFEGYKARAQAVLKDKDGDAAKELGEAREQLSELRERYLELQLSCDELERRHRRELEAQRRELCRLQQLHRQELERCQLEHRERALRLEEEMHKQRERALAVLAEKDRELESLRPHPSPQGLRGGTELAGTPGAEPAPGAPGAEPCEVLSLPPGPEPSFFLYAEQLARKEVEMVSLRKQKHQLEVQLQQLRESCLLEEDRHRDEVAELRGQLEKSSRDKGREGANLEYLKNVVYRFLTLPDALGRQQTLGAILPILHFSPQERRAVAGQAAHGSWWLSGKR
ncbi:GCC1 protein, partial [Alcedo cyanopectus]|nr:GCC1 protein [Ceyx cyanopectus]